MKFIFAFSLVFTPTIASPTASNETITPEFEIFYKDGSEIKFKGDNTSLPESGIQKFCHFGVYALYSNENYENLVRLSPFLAVCMTNYNINFQSARFVGSEVDNELPSVTFFPQTNFHGEKTLVEGGIPNTFSSPILSLVLIESREVEFFQGLNYEGESICLRAEAEEDCNLFSPVCWATDLGNIPDLPFDITLAKSATVGCTEAAPVFRTQVKADFLYQ